MKYPGGTVANFISTHWNSFKTRLSKQDHPAEKTALVAPSRTHKVNVPILAACLLAIVGFAAYKLFASAATEKMNVVYILTDDETMNSVQYMPFVSSQLDWIKFNHAFINNSLCCPSRATIMTGQYDTHTGVINNDITITKVMKTKTTMAGWLKSVGYATGVFGKAFNGFPWKATSLFLPGWTTQYAFQSNGDYNDAVFYHNNQPGQIYPGYSTDVITQKTLDFINQNASAKKPFLTYVAYKASHSPFTPAPKYASALDPSAVVDSPNFNEADVSDKPQWIKQLPALAAADVQKEDADQLNAYRTLLSVDDGIKAIYQALQAQGILNKTVIIFMTDNGYSFGNHRWTTKRCAYEECIDTPLYVRYPGIAGKTITNTVSNIDIAPTIADIAGVTPTTPVDGHSLLPLIKGQAVNWQNGVLIHWSGGNQGGEEIGELASPEFWGVRTERYMYAEYPATKEKEMYDLETDPYELNNLLSTSNLASLSTTYKNAEGTLQRKLTSLKTAAQ